jgi:hypothetical protein
MSRLRVVGAVLDPLGPRCVGCDAVDQVHDVAGELPPGWFRMLTGQGERICCSVPCGVATLDALATIEVVSLTPAGWAPEPA